MPLRFFVVSLLVAIALAGCSGGGSSRNAQSSQFSSVDFAEEQIWVRTDGKTSRNNPVLAAKFASDRASCVRKDEVEGPLIPNIQFSRATAIVDYTCMPERGYFLAARSVAEATAAGLRTADKPCVCAPIVSPTGSQVGDQAQAVPPKAPGAPTDQKPLSVAQSAFLY